MQSSNSNLAQERATNKKSIGRRKRVWVIVGVVVIIIAIFSAISYVANQPGTAPPPPSSPNVIIWDNGFCSNASNCGYSPLTRNVTQGTAITWINSGGQPHTVTICTASDSALACPNGAGSNTSPTRTFDSSAQFPSGFNTNQQFSFTFNIPNGTYHYYCIPHPWMHGTVIVS
jgi:plastocyanin